MSVSFSLIAFLFIAVFFIERLAEFLNLRISREPLPPWLQDLQAPEEQHKASAYLRDRLRLGWIRESLALALFLALLVSGFFGWLQSMAEARSDSPLLQSLIFAGALGLGQALLNLPFSAWSTFHIEERYGFNRTTLRTFITDFIKALALGAILGGTIFVFAVKLFESQGTHAWWMIWLGYTVFQFFVIWIAPVTILPLFLKLSPLPPGELLQNIEAYARKQSFKLDGVWVCDASRRSAKSNAFFTGFGRFRRLVLFDTLIEKHPVSEIVAIVAHEAGHFKLGHIWKGSIVSSISTLGILWIIQNLMSSASLPQAFQVTPGKVGITLILVSMILGKILFFLSPLGAWFSRRNEYGADRFSMDTTGDPAALLNGLKRLVTDNLGTLRQHPLYVMLHATHPPLPDRMKPLLRRLTQKVPQQ